MHCFRQSGEETFIIVVNYDCKALILSKKNERFRCFHLAKTLLQNNHRLDYLIARELLHRLQQKFAQLIFNIKTN